MTRAEAAIVTLLALAGPLQAKTLEFRLGKREKGIIHLFPDGGPRSPFILMLPMTGDPAYFFSKRLCGFLCANGFRCAYLERALPEPEKMPATVEETLKLASLPPRSALAARRALDELEKAGALSPGEKIGVAGISLGAIDAAIVALTDSRVSAAALFLGGGDIPEMLTEIKGLAVKDFSLMRSRQIAAKAWTLDDFRRGIKKYTPASDPLTYAAAPANKLPPENFLMINVAGDSAIPNSCSDELAAALSQNGAKPDYEMLSLWFLPRTWRHIGAMLYLSHAQKRMLEHFRKFLKA